MIDMEEQCMGGGVGDNIRHVLEVTQRLKLPVWLIETMVPTSAALLNILPSNIPRIRKNFFNAFVDTPLKAQLIESGCTTLIVMGATASMCVMNTICGGMEFTDFISRPGAIQFGFKVLTCQEIISGEVVGWSENTGVSFYSRM